MASITMIFPHQLFEYHPALSKDRNVYLIEHKHFFTRLQFHKKKLILHRASMKAYASYLEKKGYNITYIEFHEDLELFLHNKQVKDIHCAHLHDILLQQDIKKFSSKHNIKLTFYSSDYFLTSPSRILELLPKEGSYFMTSFYEKQRKYFKILVDSQNKPLGGKWSYDPENREKIHGQKKIPLPRTLKWNSFVAEAIEYVTKNFSNNIGLAEDFFYPVTFKDARLWFNDFLEHRLRFFGPFEDAIVQDQPFLYHSVLSPLLNIGLLTPAYVIEQTLDYAKKNNVPLNSLEGFIRQILGWREFMHAVYKIRGNEQRNSNYFFNHNSLPYSFWLGTTSVEPLDTTIMQIHTYAYAHHIERLMLFGNFMLLCEINPDDVYRWFMELFIDAYDWVMVPNVYGMSQFSDGGLLVTKPYIASANYLKKMSNFKKGNWENVFNDLFWRFVYKHQKSLYPIPRLRAVYALMNRMNPKTLDLHIQKGDIFLKKFLNGNVYEK